MRSNEYAQGNKDYWDSVLSIDDNPFDKGTAAFFEWEDGYVDGFEGIVYEDA